MMADTFVDPALFRLRAFEVEWLEPLLNDLHDRSTEVTLDRGRMEWDSATLLLYALIAEAYRWLTVGRQVGYFAQTYPSTSPLLLADPPELERLLSAIRSPTELPPGLGIREFARALSEARDDLTAERREFLRLVCFTEEAEWFERLKQISTLAEEITARPEGFAPSEIVDKVAWCLDHFGWDVSGDPIRPSAESERTVSETSAMIEFQQHLPAKWRLGSFALLANQSPVVEMRLAALTEAQASIAAAIQGLAQTQHTAPATRRARINVPYALRHVYDLIVRRLVRGKVVLVLGAGVNLSERPPQVSWELGRYLPSSQELAAELAKYIGNVSIDSYDLARVSQYLAALEGEGSLYDELHDVFDADYPPTYFHRFLARLARRTREAEDVRECMLIVTTNYDDSLERAFVEEGEPYELVTYIAEGRDRGLFRHITADGEPTVIRVPDEYVGLGLDQRTVIAKIHGSVDRIHRADSYVITEDHYIDYITRADTADLLPVTLAAKLQTSHFLFLGYSLRDWNFRVMLHRLWGEQEGKYYKSWAIQDNPGPIDRAAWDERGVDILPVRVEDFVAAIEQRLPLQQEVTRGDRCDGSSPRSEDTTDRDVPESPYVGLVPFDEKDAAYFFGRERESDLIVAHLTASRLTLLCAPSRVGKSSVLRAGVLPALHHLDDDSYTDLGVPGAAVAYVNAWRDAPLESIAAAVSAAVSHVTGAGPVENPIKIGAMKKDASAPRLSVPWLREVLRQSRVSTVYLILDQFEEYFLYHPMDRGEEGLTAALGNILSARDLPVHVLLSIREDALAGLDRFKGRVPHLFDNYLRLAHLSREAAHAAIKGPLDHYNRVAPPDRKMSIEPGLIETLLDQIRTGHLRVAAEGTASNVFASAPPASDDRGDIETSYLQLVLTCLWDAERATGSSSLRQSTLDGLGGVQTIVQTHLDNVMAGLSPAQVDVAAAVFHHLITRSGTKIALTAEDLADWAELPVNAVQDLLETLSAGPKRILRPVPPAVEVAGPPRYEIFHDVMGAAVLDWSRRYVA
jgi:conflict system STAND superfamily ATPase/SIR2-like protein